MDKTYKILVATGSDASQAAAELERQVKEHLALGWRVHGAVSVAGSSGHYVFAQAVTTKRD